MKVSLITPTYNSAATITDTLQSVVSQDYKNIEHIIVDGLSNDNTLEIVQSFPHVTKVISEKDKGIFDAMNKGIQAATGDVIGVLNSDDFFADTSIMSSIVRVISETKVDAVYGDVYFVHPKNIQKILRYYSAKNFKLWKFAFGYTPPHPTFYAKKNVYDQYGSFNSDYKYAADYELMMRLMYKQKIRVKYMAKILVIMRAGGASNKNASVKLELNREIIRACKTNGVKTNLFILFAKYIFKIGEYIEPIIRRWLGLQLKW